MDVFTPRSLEEALDVRVTHPEATPVAGGTDLMVDVNAGRIRPKALLDLSHVDEIGSWGRDNGRVFLGAGVTFARIGRELTEFHSLVTAAHSVASVQIRNRATIGGNLATASPAGDGIPVLVAYQAEVVAAAARTGRRRIRWASSCADRSSRASLPTSSSPAWSGSRWRVPDPSRRSGGATPW